MTPLLVALGAGVGAALRFVLAAYADRPQAPIGTWAVNVVGSFVLGLLVGLDVGPDALALLGVGLCGGFTTYSSFAVQTHALGAGRGAVYAGLTLLAALGAAAAGCCLGQLA